MAIVRSGESEADKELWTWDHTDQETHPDFPNLRGRRPSVAVWYPKMLYLARARPNGQPAVAAMEPSPYGWRDPAEYGQAILEAQSFTKSCQMVVESEAHEARMKSSGWRNTPADALAEYEARQQRIGNAAAEAAHAAQRMTATAKEELKAADEATHEHVTDVVPTRKRGRPRTRAQGVTV